MKATVLQCPPAQRLALQSAADWSVLIVVVLACVFIISLVRQLKRPDVARLERNLREYYEGDVERIRLEMHKEVEDLAMERDAAVDRVEALEATNAKLTERIAKLQPGAVQSYELRAKLKDMAS